MQTSDYLQLAATGVALLVALLAWIQKRRQPQLDAATTEHTLVNSDSVKQTIRKLSEESNTRRDLRILDLENWGFNEVRPWGRSVVLLFDKMCDLIREDRAALGKDMPDLHLPPFPDMPPPRGNPPGP